MLIDFGLAEPAEKWKDRSEALAKHRDRRALRRKNQASGVECLGGDYRTRPVGAGDGCKLKACDDAGAAERSREDRAGKDAVASDRLKLLKKAERGGTTGFRAPEVLWHSRDQVGSWRSVCVFRFLLRCIPSFVPPRAYIYIVVI